MQFDRESGALLCDGPDTAHSWDTWINRHSMTPEGEPVLSRFSLEEGDYGYYAFGLLPVSMTGTIDWQRADLIARALESGSLKVNEVKDGAVKSLDLERQPFFLACGISRPHPPWFAPEELLAQIDPAAIQLTRGFLKVTLDDLRDLPASAWSFTDRLDGPDAAGRGRFEEFLELGAKSGVVDGDLVAWREAVRRYLACVMLADRSVGRLLDALDRSKFKDNTIVVIWSDHGWNLGTKYHMGKSTLWDDSANCVLIVRDPRRVATAGRRCNAAVNLIDLFRTISALAGATVPEYVAGSDFSALLAEPDRPWSDIALTTQGVGNHSITDGRYRYIRYDDDPRAVELYDRATDPRELSNLAGRKEYAALQASLEAALKKVLAADKVPKPPPAPRRRRNSDGGSNGD
ncbi:MAG: DUF4976 domain-containing protein [Planctomycetes bacterium]|nr:DUF4976 domain-containing protein [Planctomycetota bacterium]